MTTTTPEAPSRRDRQRAATEVEIKDAARRLLAESGPSGVALRRIARDMGMTAPALYRYFSSLDDLLEALCCDFFTEASDAVAAAIAAAPEDVVDRMHAAIRAFRTWALEHPAEFTLMFRTRPAPVVPEGDEDDSRRFAALFLELFVQVWTERPFDLPPTAPVPSAACRQLETFARGHRIDLPDEALWAFASSWVRLYSVICMEVFGQLTFMFADSEPYFEAELQAVLASLGMAYRPLPGTA